MKYILFITGGLIILLFLRRWKKTKRTEQRETRDWTSWLREYKKEQKTLDKQVERNLKGIALEKKGYIDKAVELYEQNVSENFDGNHPYDRLAIIYRKRKQIDDEIRVLEKAVFVFKNIDRPKLNKFKEKLQKAQKTRLGV